MRFFSDWIGGYLKSNCWLKKHLFHGQSCDSYFYWKRTSYSQAVENQLVSTFFPMMFLGKNDLMIPTFPDDFHDSHSGFHNPTVLGEHVISTHKVSTIPPGAGFEAIPSNAVLQCLSVPRLGGWGCPDAHLAWEINYSHVTGTSPQKVDEEIGKSPKNSEVSRLVKYYNLARYQIYIYIQHVYIYIYIILLVI